MSYKVQHIPVLLNEVLSALSLNKDEVYVDATFGLGGYTKAILNHENSKVVAIDRDPETRFFANRLNEKFSDRLTFINGKFSDLGKFYGDYRNALTAGLF